MRNDSRRQWLVALGAAVVGAPLAAWATRGQAVPSKGFPLARSDEDWRGRLDADAFAILRRARTERAFSNPLHAHHAHGAYRCAGCEQLVFLSSDKFDSGTGWPSFVRPVEGSVGTRVDRSLFMVRTEVHCARCGGHLGHVFPDGPPPTGLRYCINGGALRFEGA